jgi:hypothetical protein
MDFGVAFLNSRPSKVTDWHQSVLVVTSKVTDWHQSVLVVTRMLQYGIREFW